MKTPAAWTTYTYTDSNDVETTVLSASTLTVNLPDLEAGATYEVQVRAVSSEEGVGDWSDTGSGQANRPPTASALSLSRRHASPGRASADYDVSDKFEDADGDTLTYSALAAYPGVLTTAITGSDSDTLRVTVLNPASSTVTYAASDAYGGYLARTVTITGTASVSRSIAENSVAGTAVGDAVAGTPHGTGTLSYTLSGEAATSGAFEIDSATGQISVKQGATIDYEAKTSYTGTVTWTVQGQQAAASLTVNVTNVTGPETPAAPSVEAGADEPVELARRELDGAGRPRLGDHRLPRALPHRRPDRVDGAHRHRHGHRRPPSRASMRPPSTRCRCWPSTPRARVTGRRAVRA